MRSYRPSFVRRGAVRFAAAGLVLVASCKREPVEEESKSEDEVVTVVEAIEPPAPYEPEPFEVRTITRSKDLGPPFKELRFRPTLTLAKGHSLRIEQQELPGNRVVIYETDVKADRETGRLYATDTGEVLAEFGQLWKVSKEQRVADVFTADRAHHLLHLDTGRLISARPSVPEGTVEQTRIVFFPPPMSWVWLFARTTDGDVYHAQWEDLDTHPPALTENFPIWPSTSPYDTLVLDPARGEPGQRPACLKVSFYPDRTFKCFPDSFGDYTFATGDIYFDETGKIGKDPRSARALPVCERRTSSHWFAGSRIVIECLDKISHQLMVWSPDRVAVSPLQEHLSGLASYMNNPVVVVGKPIEARTTWFDLGRLVRYETDPLWPFIFGAKGQSRMVVVSGTNYGETLLLDLPDERLSLISKRSGCYAYDFWFTREWGVAYECQDRKRRLIETHVVDFDRRRVVKVKSKNVWYDGERSVIAVTGGGRQVSVMRD
jgi:hypothetical protein